MSTYTKRSSTRRSDDTMDDDAEDKDDTKRKSRNLSEKKRRDQFNMLVNELSSMVSTGARKMDKSTVLRSTISFLKNHNEIAIRSRAHEIQEDWKPAFLSNEEFTHLILEALDGFIVVFSAAGHVHYVSESVTALLGHLPSELLNTSVYELIWDEEQAALYQALVGSATGNTGTGPDGQLAFQAHLRRGGGSVHQPDGCGDNRNDCYELVNFVGYLRTDVDTQDTASTIGTDSNRFSGYSGEADTRLFVGTGRLQTPQLIREMSLVDAADMAAAAVIAGSGGAGVGGNTRGSPGEFTSRHSLEWKFLFLDHRAPPIIGYLPFEVLGTSGYDYYHVDDLDKVVSCHEALMQKGEGTSCYYRFLTKGQQWIWLQTRFYITYHQWNSKPEFIVCTHRVVSYVDVLKQSRKCNDDTSPVSNNGGSNQGITMVNSSSVPTSAPESGTLSPWGAASSSHQSVASTKTGSRHHHRRTTMETPSDCTSMSADSPVLRTGQNQGQGVAQVQQIGVQHNGGRSSRMSNHSHNQLQTQVPGAGSTQGPVMFVDHSQHQLQTHLQPHQSAPQFVAAIPVQSAVITGYPAPAAAVLSPLPQQVDNSTLLMTSVSSPTDPSSTDPTTTHLQAQLQRKHAELQAIIGQQQAELRRVSEQLLMARLGLLSTPNTGVPIQQIPQQQQQMMHQQQGQLGPHVQQPHSIMNIQQHQVSSPYICNSSVSSTTQAPCMGGQTMSPITGLGVPLSVAVPVVSVAAEHLVPQSHLRNDETTSPMALSQQQAQMLFASPGGSNQQHK